MTNEPIPMPADTVRWVHALLSGNYKQTKGRLCRIQPGNKSYCCLGVAAEILNAFVGTRSTTAYDIDEQEEHKIMEGLVMDPFQKGGVNNEILSSGLWNILRGEAKDLPDQGELAGANDDGSSFAEIVDGHILPAFNHTRATFEEMYGPVPSQP